MATARPDDCEVIQRFLTWQSAAERVGTVDLVEKTQKHYILPSAVEAHFNIAEVTKLLQCFFHEDMPDPYIIWNDYRYCFAILLSIDVTEGRMIRHFFNDTFPLKDQDLPFRSKPTNFPSSVRCDLWSAFDECQWKYKILRFSWKMRGPLGYDDDRAVLPFRVVRQLGAGASACVHQIEVEDDFKDWSHPEAKTHARRYALKTFRGKNAKRAYTIERKAYETLYHDLQQPPNILGYHGSFSHRGTYHLLLEYADRGTLRDFMEKNPPPSNGEDILRCWRAFPGLLLGLFTLHQQEGYKSSSLFISGWHQDINPTNILVRSRADAASTYDCDFVLADFGLTHWKNLTGNDRNATDRDSHGTYAYGAPETYRISRDIRHAPFHVSRKVDVWSVGGVMSEFATWIGHGPMRVEQYRHERQREAARKLSNPDEGDLFHDADKVLGVVNTVHTSICASHRVDDFVTPIFVEEIIVKMLEKEQDRMDARQAYTAATIAIAQATDHLHRHRNGLPPSPPISIAEQHPAQENLLSSLPLHEQDRTLLNRVNPSHADQGLRTPSPSLFNQGSEMIDDPLQISSDDPPQVSIDEIMSWKQGNQKTQMPGSEYLVNLGGRDFVFIVDNSLSMDQHKQEARRVLEVLSYIIKSYDPDGIDMMCTQTHDKIFNTAKTTKVLRVFDRLRFQGRTDMQKKLDDILRQYRCRFNQDCSTSGFWSILMRSRAKRAKALSLYILTDGNWQRGCEVEVGEVISSMVDFLVANDLRTGKQVTIQFIRFGNSDRAIQLLRRLDDNLQLPMDIVDVTSADGNVLKMVLGAIHTWWDQDNRPMKATAFSAGGPRSFG